MFSTATDTTKERNDSSKNTEYTELAFDVVEKYLKINI